MQSQRGFFCTLAILLSCLTRGEGQGHAGIEACSRVSNVEIRFRDYFEIYLGFNRSSQSVGKDGFYYNYIKSSVHECCNFMDLNFTRLNSSEVELEEEVLTALSNDSNIPRPFVFYFPEFATNKEKIVYDFELSFVKLSRSPGQAIMMLTPETKKPVTLFVIFKESIPMLAMMLAMSWVVGILGWIADHWKNPEEFPSPFITGMFEGFWWAIVTMTTVGYGDKAPRSVPARVLAVIWVMMSAVFLSLFTANATSILNQNLQGEDYTETIGKKIGVLQSKQFDEFQLNLGAELISYDNYYDIDIDITNGKLDRFLFPDYKDLIWLMNNVYKAGKEKYKIAKVFESPFQVGMVLSMVPEYISVQDHTFLKCLRTGISAGERKLKRELGYGSISYPKNDNNDDSVALNQGNLLTTTWYILAAIAGLAVFGIIWDLWKYHTKRKTDNSEEVNVESGKENVAVTVETLDNTATQQVKDSATWF